MSKYIESVLGSGEKVEYQARMSAWSLSPLLAAGLITLPLFGIGLLFWIAAAVTYWTTELAISDRKIIASYGLFKRETIALLLTETEDVRVIQSVLGRRFDYGSIVVSAADSPRAPIAGIANPFEFRRKFKAMRKAEPEVPLKAAA